MKPTTSELDAMFRERVTRARGMDPGEKAMDGARLFDYACRITMDGIRDQHPDATDSQIRQMLADRLALRDRLENRQ